MKSEHMGMLQRRFDLRAEGNALLAKIVRTDDEQDRLEAITEEMTALQGRIDTEEIKREAMLNAPSLSGRQPAGREGTGPRFADMFGQPAGNAGFKSFGEFASAFNSGMWHPGYQALMTGGDGNGTGLMIPPQFAAELWDISLENEVVRPRARIEPMTSDTKVIAGLSHSDGTDAPFGISGGWVAQGAEITIDDPQVRGLVLAARKLAALVQISNEAAADGTSIDVQLRSALTRGLGWLLDKAFLTGTGAGEPLGILNAPACIEVAKEGAQVADTLSYANLVKMFSRLAPACIGNSVWVASVSTIPQLLQMTVADGSSLYPVLKESNGQFNILTRPVIFSEKMPALGDRGDIALCDFSQYAVGLRAEIIVDKSSHVGFTRDTTYYRALVRADGQPTWDKAYTPAHGVTLSPFVTLAERA